MGGGGGGFHTKITFHGEHLETNGTKRLNLGSVRLQSLDLPNCGSSLVLVEMDLPWLVGVYC